MNDSGKSVNLPAERKRAIEREPRGGEEFEDVERRAQICPEQHVSAVSFPILTEADYSPPLFCADTFGTRS